MTRTTPRTPLLLALALAVAALAPARPASAEPLDDALGQSAATMLRNQVGQNPRATLTADELYAVLGPGLVTALAPNQLDAVGVVHLAEYDVASLELILRELGGIPGIKQNVASVGGWDTFSWLMFAYRPKFGLQLLQLLDPGERQALQTIVGTNGIGYERAHGLGFVGLYQLIRAVESKTVPPPELFAALPGATLGNLIDEGAGLDLVQVRALFDRLAQRRAYLAAVAAIGDSGAVLRDAVDAYGIDFVAQVLAAAADGRVAPDALLTALTRIVSAAFHRDAVAQVFQGMNDKRLTAAQLTAAVDAAHDLVVEGDRTTSPSPIRNLTETTTVLRARTLAAGQTPVEVQLTTADVDHIATGHTFAALALATTTGFPAAATAMFPRRTTRGDLIALATRALASDAVRALVATLNPQGGQGIARVDVRGTTYFVTIRIAGGRGGLVAMEPADGDDVTVLDQLTAQAAIVLAASAPAR